MPRTRALSSARVARVGAVSLVALIALGLARLVHGSLVGRVTEPAGYGLVGSLIGLAYVAGLFLPAGLASATTKYVAGYRGQGRPDTARAAYRLLGRLTLIAAVGLGVLCAAAARWWFGLSTRDTALVGLLTAVFAVYSNEKAALYGFGQAGGYARLELIGSGLAVVATIAVVAGDSHDYLAPLVIGYGVVVLGARLVLRPTHGPRGEIKPAERREMLAFAGLAALGSVAAAGFLQGVPLLATGFTGRAEVGYLVAAVTLVSPLYLLPRVLGLALFPAMAESRGAGDEAAVRRSADVSLRALLVPLAPVFAAALPLAGPILVAFGGSAYAGGEHALQILLVATYLAVVSVGPINALSSGELRDVLRPVGYAVAGGLVGLAAVPLLGRPFGAVGVGLAYLIGIGLTSAGPIGSVWRRWGMAWTGPVLRSLGALAAAFTVSFQVSAFADPLPLRLLVAVLLAALVCGILRSDLITLLRDARTPAATGVDAAAKMAR